MNADEISKRGGRVKEKLVSIEEYRVLQKMSSEGKLTPAGDVPFHHRGYYESLLKAEREKKK